MLHRQFLSVRDVADLLKVGEVAVRSWIRAGDLRAVTVAREWRIAPGDLERFLARQANRPPDDDAPSARAPGRAGEEPPDPA